MLTKSEIKAARMIYSPWRANGNFRIRSRRFLNPVFEIEEWRRRGRFNPANNAVDWSDDTDFRWRRVTNGEFGINTRFIVERVDAETIHEQIEALIRLEMEGIRNE